MNILGFSGITRGEFYRRKYGLRFVGHDSGVALFVDGVPVFAVEEERISRRKHTSELPLGGLRAALDHAGIRLEDVDCFAYTWEAGFRRLASMFLRHPPRIPVPHWPALAVAGVRVIRDLMSSRRAGRDLARALGAPEVTGRTVGVPHHLGHAACAYYTSPFEHAAVLTVDGQGEDESGTMGEFRGTRYRLLRRVPTPDSIGIFYGMVTDFLGMRAAWDEYKVMGMAAYGDPDRFGPALDRLVRTGPNGTYRTRGTALVFKPGFCDRMLARALGLPPRRREEELAPVHFDVAAALQQKTEEILLHLTRHLRTLTDSRCLCLAGGVFQNSVANGKILESGLFDRVHVPPVPGDQGGAFGAAAFVAHRRGNRPRRDLGFSAFLGPEYPESSMEEALRKHGIPYERVKDIAESTADLLARDLVAAWFQGRLEYGPRALGHRSILASPLRRGMRGSINARVKHREPFRPFAGAVPLERAAEFFDLGAPSPYMQFVMAVKEDAISRVPAIVHHGTCRAQTVERESDPLFFRLLSEFGDRTGVPVLLNTSLNDADEPIVCSPDDACRTFLATEIDILAIGPFLARRPEPRSSQE